MIEHDYSMRKIRIQQIWDDIFALNPSLRENQYARFSYREFREAEDQDERAPPISEGMMRIPVGLSVTRVHKVERSRKANSSNIGEEEIWAIFHKVPQIFILQRWKND